MSKYATRGLAWGTNWTIDVSDCKTSAEVMEKAGMKFEGVLRSRVIDKNGKRNNLINYSILKEEYYNNSKYRKELKKKQET